MIVLKINTLKKGWHDKDEILLHAAFQVLIDFMEKEKPDEIIDYTHDAEQRREWKELSFLYKWWTETRPNRVDPMNDETLKKPAEFFKKQPTKDGSTSFMYFHNPDPKYRRYWKAVDKSIALEKKWLAEDQKNLERLIAIRSHLWT